MFKNLFTSSGAGKESELSEMRKNVQNASAECNKKKQQLLELDEESKLLDEQIERNKDRLQHINEELKYRKEELDAVTATKNQSKEKKGKHNIKEIDDIIRDKIKEMTSNIRHVEDIDPDIREVTVTYLQGIRSGDTTKFRRTPETSVLFNVNKTTTFNELKEAACSFWAIERPAKMQLHMSNFSLINLLDERIIITMKEQKQKKPELFFYEVNEKAAKIFSDQKDFFYSQMLMERYDAPEIKPKNLVKKKKKDTLEEIFASNFKQLVNHFKGLESYTTQKNEQQGVDVKEYQRLHGMDTSCLTLLVLIVLLVLGVVVTQWRFDSNAYYWISESVRSPLLTKFTNDQDLENVTNMVEFNQWQMQVFPNIMFESGNPARQLRGHVPVTNYFEVVGPLRLRVVKTKTKTCRREEKYDIENLQWYEENYKLDGNREKDTLPKGEYPWNEYQDKDETEIDMIIFGEFSDYDGSGYVRDIDMLDMNDVKFNAIFLELAAAQWFDRSTRAYMIQFTLYDANADQWVTSVIMFEFGISGIINPSFASYLVFKPNLFDGKEDIMAADILRLMFTLYIIYMYLRAALERIDETRNWQYMYSFQGFCDVGIVGFTGVGFAMSYFVREDSEELYNDGKFYDYMSLAEFQYTSVTMNSISVFFVLIRITWILRINKRANNLMLTIEIAAKNIFSYMILLLPIFIGFCLVSMNILGPYYLYYRNFEISLLSNLLFAIGEGDIVAMFRINREWGVMIFVIFWFVIVFFVLSVFLGILMDAYRLVRMRQGYTDDDNAWELKDYIQWGLHWLPYGVLLGLMTKALKKIKIPLLPGGNKKDEEDGEGNAEDQAAIN